MDQTDGAMIMEKMHVLAAGDTETPTSVRLWDMSNLAIYPNATNIETSQALKTVDILSDGETQGSLLTNRRLLQHYPRSQDASANAPPTTAPTNPWNLVPIYVPSADDESPLAPTPAPTIPFEATTGLDTDIVRNLDTRFPQLVGRSREDGVDIQCTNAHTFAFVGAFKSTEARYGYRRVFSKASEAGLGGVQLLLSPDGHLKDRSSNVTIATQGVNGCLSIVIIDCFEEYRVSVDGQIVHYHPRCPFDVRFTDTRVHSWVGREDVMCFSGQRLHPNRHFELVAYFQSIYGKWPYDLCYKPRIPTNTGSVRNTLHTNFFALPRNAFNATFARDRLTWQVSQLSTMTAHGFQPSQTTMRCKAEGVCRQAGTEQVFYKEQSANYRANCFYMRDQHGHYARLVDASAVTYGSTPSTRFVKEVQWLPSANIATCFNSSMELQDEIDACQINQGKHEVAWSAPVCDCADDKFTPWEEDVDRSDPDCPPCQMVEQTHVHPQWSSVTQLRRFNGSRFPDTQSVRKFYTRILNSTEGGCPELHANPASVTTKSEIVQCPKCPTDALIVPKRIGVARPYTQQLMARIAAMALPASTQPSVIMHNAAGQLATNDPTCPSSREEQNVYRPQDRVSCTFHLYIQTEAADGGLSALDVVRRDFLQLGQDLPLQKVGDADFREVSGASTLVTPYTANDTSTLITNGYHQGEFVVSVTLTQRPLYSDETWNWVTPEMAPYVHGNVDTLCPRPCAAKFYSNMPLYESSSTNHALLTNVLAYTTIVIVTMVVVYLIVHPLTSPAKTNKGAAEVKEKKKGDDGL